MNRRDFTTFGVPLLVGAIALFSMIFMLLNAGPMLRKLSKPNGANPVVVQPQPFNPPLVVVEPQPFNPPFGAEPVAAESSPFTSVEGKTGWRVAAGRGALATPTVVNDQVLIGRGFAAFEFRAFDSATGKSVWRHRTSDNGPSSAVVENDRIIYNTESCKLEVITTAGTAVWTKWLGDPLLTTPAVAGGRIYTSFPSQIGDGDYQLICLELNNGAIVWQTRISTEIITSVTIDNDRLYFATYDGKLSCYNRDDGATIWQDDAGAVSSPQVVGDRVYFQRRVMEGVAFSECLGWRDTAAKASITNVAGTARDPNSSQSESNRRASEAGYYSALDSQVGWSEGSVNLTDAKRNLGLSTAAAIWSFQGSRPFHYEGRLFRSFGSAVQCVDPVRGEVVWTEKSPNAGQMTAPALANGKVFVGTSSGMVICLSADTGAQFWQATVGEPVCSQVAIAHGRAFVSTREGSLFCIETGDPNDHGWPMWAGNSGNGGKSAK